MATIYEYNSPPIKGSAFTFYITLVSQADTDIFKTSPTLAAGDITVSVDGASFDNIAVLPTQIASTGVLPVALSTTEMNGNVIIVKFVDAAGAEWQDALAVIRTVSDAGLYAGVWSYATRTLTQTAAQVDDVLKGSNLTIHRGDTFSATLTGLAANTGYVSIDFTVKADKDDTDAEAIVKIRKNASALTDGLLYLNAAAPVSPVIATDGSITVNSATSLTIALAARASDDLVPADNYFYDLQYYFAADVVQTATEGTAFISADVTRAIA